MHDVPYAINLNDGAGLSARDRTGNCSTLFADKDESGVKFAVHVLGEAFAAFAHQNEKGQGERDA